MLPTGAPVTRKFQLTPAPPAPALILVSESSFCMTQVLFKLLPLIWNLEQISLPKALLKPGLVFLPHFSSQRYKPHWFSKSDVIEAQFPSPGSPGWETHSGAQTSQSSDGNIAVMIFLLLMGHHPRSMGSA